MSTSLGKRKLKKPKMYEKICVKIEARPPISARKSRRVKTLL
jgi:ribosomal protein L40E